MRVWSLVVSALLAIACDGGGRSPVAPTPVITPAPVVVVQAPPPQPIITNYAGRWTGFYIVEQCAGSSGSMDDVLCSAPRPGNSGGIFQRGASFPITLELSQNASSVTGVISYGQIRGNVSGSVRSDQSLFLSGTATSSGGSSILTISTTDWSTLQSGGQLNGTIAISVRFNDLPGEGVVRVRLSNVRR